MAGNDLETAISMFFEQSAMTNNNNLDQMTNTSTTFNSNDRPEWFNLIWPKNLNTIPESWLNQKLEFSTEIKYGLVQ